MAKRYNIKWKPDDSQELRKAVKNFNAKINRLAKKNPQIKNLLPDKVTVKEMKDLIQTRQDLKRELNSLKRFTKRGAEKIVDVPGTDYNIKTTKWQKEEITRRIGVINRKRAIRHKQITELQATDRGKPLGYTIGDIGMKKADEIALKPMNAFTKKMSQADLKQKFKSARRESQDFYWERKEQMMKQNYYNAILSNYDFGEFKEDIEMILKVIDEMDFKEFYQTFQSENADFEIPSPKAGQDLSSQYQINVDALKSTWLPTLKNQYKNELVETYKNSKGIHAIASRIDNMDYKEFYDIYFNNKDVQKHKGLSTREATKILESIWMKG